MTDKNIRVLLVDDEETLIEYLSKRLLREGFTVKAASSGEAALKIASSEDFDVAVVDLRMPGLDGLETQKKLKELQPNLQIIVLTGHSSFDTALESGRQNAFTYMEKPADHEVLVKNIHDAYDKKAEILQSGFNAAMEKIVASGASPKEMLHEIEALRKKFGIK